MSCEWFANWHDFPNSLCIQHEKWTLLVTKLPEVIIFLQLEAFKKQLMKSLSEDNLLVSCINEMVLTLLVKITCHLLSLRFW
jgi:hypothetical protein